MKNEKTYYYGASKMLPKGFYPSKTKYGVNRKQRRSFLFDKDYAYNLKKRGSIMIVVGKNRFKHFLQSINSKMIEHMVIIRKR